MAAAQVQKPLNGQAQSNSYLLVFDLDDEAQAKAWEVAQQLASQRKLKHVLVGMLLAVYTVQEQTGKALDLLQFMAAFITGLIHGGNGGYGPVRITEATAPEELPSMFAGRRITPTRPRRVRTSAPGWGISSALMMTSGAKVA